MESLTNLKYNTKQYNTKYKIKAMAIFSLLFINFLRNNWLLVYDFNLTSLVYLLSTTVAT